MCLVQERKKEKREREGEVGSKTDYVRGLLQHIPSTLKPLFESDSLKQAFEKKYGILKAWNGKLHIVPLLTQGF